MQKVKCKTPERERIYQVLNGAEAPMSPKEVATELDKDPNSVTRLLRKMLSAGTVHQPAHGKYEAAGPEDGKNSKNGKFEGREKEKA